MFPKESLYAVTLQPVTSISSVFVMETWVFSELKFF